MEPHALATMGQHLGVVTNRGPSHAHLESGRFSSLLEEKRTDDMPAQHVAAESEITTAETEDLSFSFWLLQPANCQSSTIDVEDMLTPIDVAEHPMSGTILSSLLYSQIVSTKGVPVYYCMGVNALNVLTVDEINLLTENSLGHSDILLALVINLPNLKLTSDGTAAILADQSGVAFRKLLPNLTAASRIVYEFTSGPKGNYSDILSRAYLVYNGDDTLKDLKKKNLLLLATEDDGTVLVIRDQSLSSAPVKSQLVANILAHSFSGLNVRRIIINGHMAGNPSS